MDLTTLTSTILSEIVTGLMWCFSDWCTCSHGIHTETWPTPSTETLSIPSYQSGTSRTWAVIIHLTTDILSSHCMQCIRQDTRTSVSCLWIMYILYDLPLLVFSMNALDSVCGLGKNSFTKHIDLMSMCTFFI